MNVSKKIVLGIAVSFFSGFAFSQSLEEGIISIDSHKYAKAKKNFETMVASAPTAQNYFYLGNAYLTQEEPDFAKASEYFNKGLEKNKNISDEFLQTTILASDLNCILFIIFDS